MYAEKNDWVIVYEKAIKDDGSLLFPERLSHDVLNRFRRTMGSYLFANQYQNEIIPEGMQTFKKEWFRYSTQLPQTLYHFAFVDPAISEASTADYTGVVVVAVDPMTNWYVRYARRVKINPSEIIELCFKIQDQFNTQSIGVEDVAFQRAILHFAHEEMRRRKRMIPITGVKRGTDKTKEMRILSLVPRFEWGTLFLTQGLSELEEELIKFPRGAHDDVIDALASLEEIVYYPSEKRRKDERPNPNDPNYESWYIKQLVRRSGEGSGGDDWT